MKIFFVASAMFLGSNVFAAVVDPCEQNMGQAAQLLEDQIARIMPGPVRLKTATSFSYATKSGDVLLVMNGVLKNPSESVVAGGLFECNVQTGEYEFKRIIHSPN